MFTLTKVGITCRREEYIYFRKMGAVDFFRVNSNRSRIDCDVMQSHNYWLYFNLGYHWHYSNIGYYWHYSNLGAMECKSLDCLRGKIYVGDFDADNKLQ